MKEIKNILICGAGMMGKNIGYVFAYVSAVVVRVLAGQGAREDVEELTADVFLALWAHAGELNPEQGL